MNTFRLAIFSTIVALLLGPQLAIAVDEQTQKDAAFVLSKATSLVDIQAAGGVPFVLLADVTLREDKKSADGLFAMSWAAPGQYRRVFRFPGFTATEVVSDGIIYRQRSTEALPLMIWELDNLLPVASAYRLRPHWKIRGVQTERSGGSDLTCVLTRASLTESRICVNAVTGEPFSITRGIDAYRLELARERSEYADYQSFEGRSFPRKLTFRGWDSHVVEVRVKKLIRVQSFSADEFTPPKVATRAHYCEFPDTTGELRPSTRGHHSHRIQ
jgi:hypothetical protein